MNGSNHKWVNTTPSINGLNRLSTLYSNQFIFNPNTLISCHVRIELTSCIKNYHPYIFFNPGSKKLGSLIPSSNMFLNNPFGMNRNNLKPHIQAQYVESFIIFALYNLDYLRDKSNVASFFPFHCTSKRKLWITLLSFTIYTSSNRLTPLKHKTFFG